MSERSSSSPSGASSSLRATKKEDDDDDYALRRRKTGKSSEPSSPDSSSRESTPSQQQRRLHVWTDHQVLLLLKAAVALKVDPNTASWGKMTGYYAEMAKMLREAPDAEEEWGENLMSTLTVPKIRSKYESVMLLLATNRYRVRSKDPSIRSEIQDYYNQLRTLQATRVSVSPQEATKRWKDELEKLRQLWVAAKKTDLPKARSQSALKAIRDLKKLRPQLDEEGNCIFPDTVLFDGKVSSEIAAQAQAAVALSKNTDSAGSNGELDADDEEDDDDDGNAAAAAVQEQAEEADGMQHNSDKGPDSAASSVLQERSVDDMQMHNVVHKKEKTEPEVEPKRKRHHADTASPLSEETAKELIVLLKAVLDDNRVLSCCCTDCNQDGGRCGCRILRSELLAQLCITDSCPACHHPICHHP